MKNYQCDCEYAIFPFGNGIPICIKDVLEYQDVRARKNCIEKGCKDYKAKTKERSNT